MSAAFTTQIRTGGKTIQLASGAGTIAFRVEAAELWDTVRVVARPDTPIAEVKRAVLETLLPNADLSDDYVLKLRGWEVLDHAGTVQDSGVVDGAILLLAHRRRRTVR